MRFHSVSEARPGARWRALFDRAWPAYRAWFLRDGDAARPNVDTSRQMLRSHMPELELLWDELVALSGGAGRVARMLSLVNPTPFVSGCSQAVWKGQSPLLVRNYDYHPRKCEGTFMLTRWTGTRVIASSDCLWGALDGLNEHGLCVALSFGGRRVVGEGFGIPLILRYVLEVARTTGEAVGHLCRIPCHMAYNVSVLDRAGNHVVVELSPDREAMVVETAIATNRQEPVDWSVYEEISRSGDRHRFLEGLLADPALDGESLTSAFLRPPLFNDDYLRGFGTLYTACYDPANGRATFIWPDHRWTRSFESFEEDVHVAAFELHSSEIASLELA